MKLELSVADDRELRTFIKDLIKGEIVSIARGEVKGILAEVIKEGVVPKTPEQVDNMIKEEVRSVVRSTLAGTSGYWATDALKALAREETNKLIRELLTNGRLL